MGKVDLHIHTTYSYDGTATVAATLEHVVRNTDLDVIAITDHDQIDGALEALDLAPRYGIGVIPGVEVSTAEGHLLALFVKRSLPIGLSLTETVHAVAEQGGLAVAPHPGGPWRWSLQEESLARALVDPIVARTLVGLETYNASLPNLKTNRCAAGLGKRFGLATVGNSDAHLLWMIGMAATDYPGHGAQSVKAALLTRRTSPVVTTRPGYFIPSYLTRQVLRMAGLAQWSPTAPGGPIALRRLAALRSSSQDACSTLLGN